MITINSNHMPTPHGHHADLWSIPQHCAFCPQPIYHIEGFGWIHHERDLTRCHCPPPDHQCPTNGPE